LDYKALTCTLIDYIEQSIKGKPNYHVMEQVIGYSYRHLRDIFQQTTKISLSRYILTRKIANAAFELRHSSKSITDIAFDYDFTNPEVFTRAFRRNTGLTPSNFKRSSYLCGRRIICPGVYAPVIHGLDNPLLTLHNFKEVNEMAEMVKTTDSCILYGVPRMGASGGADGLAQSTPFPMCLLSVLNYMGQNISYAEIMACSGAAFRQRWDSNGWNVAAVDIRLTYEEHLKPFEFAFKGAGRSFKISENPDKPKSVTKGDAIALIKAELDCGRPVIALGVVGPPEACIVTGYRNNGETLLGWSIFQDFWGGCEIDESGYFIKDNWWEETEAIMSIGEDIGSRIPDKKVLENGLMLMTTEEMRTYGGSDLFYGGQASYKAWAAALEEETFPGKMADGTGAGDIGEAEQMLMGCQGDAEQMLWEGRGYAAVYMKMLAEAHPSAAKELSECANLLRAASDCVPGIWAAKEDSANMQDKQVRANIAALIQKAAQYEQEACKFLKQAIDKM